MNIFTASKLSGLKADGLLGLAPQRKKDKKVHLLVTELKKDKVIDKAMFAVYLSEYYNKQSKSTVRFGGYDKALVGN